MLRYFIRRLLLIIPVLIGCVVIVFTINYFSPISPVETILSSFATEEEIEAKEDELGLNDPYLTQLGNYFWKIITKFDFGVSYVHEVPVRTLILKRMPVSIKIGIFASILAALIGIPLGVLSAVKQGKPTDYAASFIAILLGACPAFVLCLFLQLLFTVKLKWLPVTGITSVKGYILPIVASSLMPVGMIMRMTRSSMLETVRQDFIRTARAKGVPEKKVIWKHCLKNALIPIVTVVGNNFGVSMTGSLITENIFNIPGLGYLMNSSIITKDYITTQGCVVFTAFFITFCVLLTDMVYALVDPRIKVQYQNMGRKKARKNRTEKKVTVA